MKKIRTPVRGDSVNIDLLRLKSQLITPPSEDVKKRQEYIEKKLKRYLNRIKKNKEDKHTENVETNETSIQQTVTKEQNDQEEKTKKKIKKKKIRQKAKPQKQQEKTDGKESENT